MSIKFIGNLEIYLPESLESKRSQINIPKFFLGQYVEHFKTKEVFIIIGLKLTRFNTWEYFLTDEQREIEKTEPEKYLRWHDLITPLTP